MDIKETEIMIDKLLVFMNDKAEEGGHPISVLRFFFEQGGEDLVSLCSKFDWESEKVYRILNKCLSRNLIDKNVMDGTKYNSLILTRKGQGRAISSLLGHEREDINPRQTHIGTLNVNGPTQVGNGNSQNIESLFYQLIDQIDNSSAPKADKDEAKGLLTSFLEHPLTSAIVGGAVGGITGSLNS